LITPFSMTGRRPQEVSLIVLGDEEAVPLPRRRNARQGKSTRSVGAMEAPGQREADSRLSGLASVRECSADRETVLAGVRNLADQAVQLAEELNRARKGVASEAKRREVIPRHLTGRSTRPRGWSVHCLAC
jgi:hypothetical protein